MKTYFQYLILFIFWISSSLSWGSLPNPFQGAIDHLQQGKELYYQLSFEQALKHLLLAQKDFEANASQLTRGEYLFDAYIFAALCHFSQKKHDLARPFIENAHRLNPKRTVREDSYAPPFVEFFKKTISEYPVKTSVIEIHSVPPFSTVTINGFKMGLTPLILKEWPVGKISIRLSQDDYQDWVITENLTENKERRIQAKLSPIKNPSWIKEMPISKQSPSESTFSSDTEAFLKALEEKEPSEASWTQSVWFWSAAALAIGGLTVGLVNAKQDNREEKAPSSPQISVKLP